MRIDQDVQDILQKSTFENGVLRLPPGQLDRKFYLKVNKALEGMGGKWDRKAKGHLFRDDPRAALGSAVETGAITTPQEEGFFETPSVLAAEMVGRALRASAVPDGEPINWLEPSAGEGAIAVHIIEAIARLLRSGVGGSAVFIEKNEDRYRRLLKRCPRTVEVRGQDFLDYDLRLPFDRIVMNPPFAKQADIDHVTHALSLLAPHGVLVSVMAAGVRFRTNRKTAAFLDLLERYDHEFEDLPEDTFKESGTGVRACLLTAIGKGGGR